MTTIGPIAVGGTAKPGLYCYSSGPCEGINCSPTKQFDRPYETETGDGPIDVVDTDPSHVEVIALDEGTNELRILSTDGETYGVAQMSAKGVDHIEVGASGSDIKPTGASVAFAAEFVGFATFTPWSSDGERLRDESSSLVLPPSLEPQRAQGRSLDVSYLAPGAYSVGVNVGDYATSVAVNVVDHAEQIVPQDLPLIPRQGGVNLCFAARYQGQFVTGLIWSYTVNSQAGSTLGNNCVYVRGEAGYLKQTIVATAGGQSLSVDVPQDAP